MKKEIEIFKEACLNKYLFLKQQKYKKSDIITSQIEKIQLNISTEEFILLSENTGDDFIKLEVGAQLLTRNKDIGKKIIESLKESGDYLVKHDAQFYLNFVIPKLDKNK